MIIFTSSAWLLFVPLHVLLEEKKELEEKKKKDRIRDSEVSHGRSNARADRVGIVLTALTLSSVLLL